jgi:hypothetical protein
LVFSPSHGFKLLITQICLRNLILQPIIFAYIKPCFRYQGHCDIKVSSALKTLPKTNIIPELDKQGCELLFRHRLTWH